MEVFDAHDVPAAPVLDLDGHLSHPQVTSNATYGILDHPRIGRHRFARYPARFAAAAEATTTPFPELDGGGRP
jgi:crotonobetainyl-CoA:carnitine CoA-transferase CaiB-like acyl-CoA transferase